MDQRILDLNLNLFGLRNPCFFLQFLGYYIFTEKRGVIRWYTTRQQYLINS